MGSPVGFGLGIDVGPKVGSSVGSPVGFRLGIDVGPKVGSSVAAPLDSGSVSTLGLR